MEKRESCVYLDMRGITNVEQRFPNICRNCWEWGIDPVQDSVPVSPAAHYMMGGIKSDVDGKTGILGLYSCGECACTRGAWSQSFGFQLPAKGPSLASDCTQCRRDSLEAQC